VRAHPVPLSGAWVRIGTCRPCSAQLRPPAPARGDAGEGVSRQGTATWDGSAAGAEDDAGAGRRAPLGSFVWDLVASVGQISHTRPSAIRAMQTPARPLSVRY
jgi:hypothetical protein